MRVRLVQREPYLIKNRHEQLGMNVGTATNKLLKDILFDFVNKAGYTCHRCGGVLERDNFSIEHKEPWMHKEDPQQWFFSLDNIGYSHRNCNSNAARRVYTEDDPVKDRRRPLAGCGTNSSYTRGCRCDECRKAHAEYGRSRYTTEKRKIKYLEHGY